jgi:hypothetical protein
MTLLYIVLSYFLFTFWEPILVYRLKEFNLGNQAIGLIFPLTCIFYILGSITVQFIKISKIKIMTYGGLLASIGLVLLGPTEIFGVWSS